MPDGADVFACGGDAWHKWCPHPDSASAIGQFENVLPYAEIVTPREFSVQPRVEQLHVVEKYLRIGENFPEVLEISLAACVKGGGNPLLPQHSEKLLHEFRLQERLAARDCDAAGEGLEISPVAQFEQIVTFPFPLPGCPNDPLGYGAGYGPILRPEWIITPETNYYNFIYSKGSLVQ